MVTKKISMHTLSSREQRTLVAIMNERYGAGLDYEQFSEGMLGVFEDIPGFETMSPEQANPLLLTLWNSYHG